MYTVNSITKFAKITFIVMNYILHDLLLPSPLRSLWSRLFAWLPSWKPTSETHLEQAEAGVLKGICIRSSLTSC